MNVTRLIIRVHPWKYDLLNNSLIIIHLSLKSHSRYNIFAQSLIDSSQMFFYSTTSHRLRFMTLNKISRSVYRVMRSGGRRLIVYFTI